MAADDLIVTATSEMPATPEGLIRSPAPLFPVEPPEMDSLRRKFNEARDLTQEARLLQLRDRDYYDGPKQLNSEVRTTLKMRGQPAIWTNRVQPAIDGILGVMEAAKVDPQAYPRNPDDENAADVCTKALRFIADKANFDEVKLDVAENFWIEGIGAAIIEGDPENVRCTQIRWEEFFYDPRSRRPDFKDARYMGFGKWMYADTVKAMYPEAYEAMGDPIEGGVGIEATWSDKPEQVSAQWVDVRTRRMMVVTLFYSKDGEWFRCVYCAAGVFDHAPSGYLDKPREKGGRNINPIEAQSCYVDSDNMRYGRVRNMIPIQDEINARRSRLLHLANSRQIQERELGASQVDVDVARAEAAKADGVIPTGWQLVPTADLAAGQQLLLTESKTEIERMGPTPAVLGRQGGASESGRARLVMQQAGLTELARPMGRLQDWETRCYRQMFMRAQQFWTEPMWIRVTDDTRTAQFMQINEPVMGMVLQPMIDPATQQPIVDPNTGQPMMEAGMGVVEYKNRIAELDLDINVETVPDQANLAAEVWGELMQLVSSAGGLQVVFTPEFEMMIQASPIADKARLIEMLQTKRKEQQEAQAEQAQQEAQQAAKVQAIAEAGAAADIENTQADTLVKVSTAHKNAAQADDQQAQTYWSMGLNPLLALQD